MNTVEHRYIDRATGNVMRERLLADSVIAAMYSPALESAPLLAHLASSRYVSRVLGYLNYDNLASSRVTGMLRFLRDSGIDVSEFVETSLTTTPRESCLSGRYGTGLAGRCRVTREPWYAPRTRACCLAPWITRQDFTSSRSSSRFPSYWARTRPGRERSRAATTRFSG